jgi:hypothetical protein
MEVPAAHDEVIRSKGMVRLTDQFAPVAIHPSPDYSQKRANLV